MKFLAWFGGIVVALVGAVYLMFFTSFGNGILAPIIESKIQEQTKLPSKLTTFSLSINEFEVLLELNKNNTIHAKGNYSLFSQSFDVAYRVSLLELESLEPLTQAPLRKSFKTQGSVVGDMEFFEVNGTSDVAKSQTSYYVAMSELSPSAIVANVKELDLASLLEIGAQKRYADAKINLDVDFKNITPHELDGKILLTTKEGRLSQAVMKKDFNITIPPTTFTTQLKATLAGDDVEYTYFVNSNLAKISSSGNVRPEPFLLDVKYGLDIKELAALKPITGADVRGSFRLSGTAKGDKESLVVAGRSDVAASDTSFSAKLHEFKPKSVSASIKNMQLQKILYMIKQPHYTDGLFSMQVDISSADVNNLKGEVSTKITEGLLDSKFLTKEFEFESLMPTTRFTSKSVTRLKGEEVNTELHVASTLANLDIAKASFNLQDASLLSDYRVRLHDLNKLFFVTQRKLKGAIEAHGELRKGKDLDFSAFSDVAGGKLKATLHNDDFKANIATMQTLDILDILIYPKIFDASINGDLTYNLAAKKGAFKGALKNGKFTKNQVLDLAKQYAHTDLYPERFKGDVNANIAQEKIVASLDLESNRSHIKTKDAKLNSKTKRIDAQIDINANGNPLELGLSGNANAPKVSVNAEKLIKKEATKAIEKEVGKFMKSDQGKDLQKEVNKLFKGLF